VLNEWMYGLKHLMLESISNGDLYHKVNALFESYSLEELTIDGVSISPDAFIFCGCKLDNLSARRLMYMIRDSATKVFIAAGWRTVIGQVMDHYSYNNTTLNTVLDMSNFNKNGAHLCPLEHAIYLFRHSMEYHQDY
jgi:hypothetical protein